MSIDDADVVRHVVAGNVSDYRILVERYQDAIYRFVHNLARDRHDAEDITQEAFLAAYRGLASFDSGRAMFSTWLFTIARNRAISHVNRRRDTHNFESRSGPVDMRPRIDTAQQGEFIEKLNDALNELPIAQRTVFLLAEVEGLSQAEIADIERISVGTVKSRLHRAKRRLQAALQSLVGDS